MDSNNTADRMILFRTRGLPPDERIDAAHDCARRRDPVVMLGRTTYFEML
jgi:hypothetical protein